MYSYFFLPHVALITALTVNSCISKTLVLSVKSKFGSRVWFCTSVSCSSEYPCIVVLKNYCIIIIYTDILEATESHF